MPTKYYTKPLHIHQKQIPRNNISLGINLEPERINLRVQLYLGKHSDVAKRGWGPADRKRFLPAAYISIIAKLSHFRYRAERSSECCGLPNQQTVCDVEIKFVAITFTRSRTDYVDLSVADLVLFE